MAESVKNLLAAGLALLLAAQVSAQTLPDPTRPPDALNPASAAGTAVSGPVLQSVLISHGRRVAIIGGQEVRQNGKYGESTVVRITATEVVLRNGKAVQKLRLFPQIEKQPVKRSGSKKSGKRRRKKVR